MKENRCPNCGGGIKGDACVYCGSQFQRRWPGDGTMEMNAFDYADNPCIPQMSSCSVTARREVVPPSHKCSVHICDRRPTDYEEVQGASLGFAPVEYVAPEKWVITAPDGCGHITRTGTATDFAITDDDTQALLGADTLIDGLRIPMVPGYTFVLAWSGQA